MEITVTYHCPRAFLKAYIFGKAKNDKFCHNSLKLLALSSPILLLSAIRLMKLNCFSSAISSHSFQAASSLR